MPNDPRTGINDFYDPSAGRNPYIGEKVLYDTGQGIQAIPWTGSAAPGQGTQLSYQQALNAFSKAQGNPQMFNSSASDYAQLQNKTGAFDPTISSNYLKFNPTATDLSVGNYTPQAAQSYVAPPAGILAANYNLIGNPGYKPPNNPTVQASITSDVMKPTSPINYSTANGTSTNPGTSPTNYAASATLNGLMSQYQSALTATPGPQDQKISDLVSRLTSLNDTEAGRAGYQQEQNTAAGVDTNQATVNSLTAQRQQILAEHATAQLQTQQGEGVTTAIDSRQRAEETRQNAIKVLSINTLLDAANGDLANAQLKANKAVAMKYDPIEAEIKAKMDNLNLIKNDPATTAEEKARADAQQGILDQIKEQIAAAKTQSAEASKIAVTAASYINNFMPTAQYPTAAQALQAIQNSDPVTGQTIAEQTGLAAPTVKSGTWGAPFTMNGEVVQKNDVTGEIRTAVTRVPSTIINNPGPPAQKTYAIKSGDTLTTIAQQQGLTLSALQAANPSVNPTGLRPGQVINLPTTSNSNQTTAVTDQDINKAIAASGAAYTNASDVDKAAYIRSMGGNPVTFGITGQ